MYELGVNEVKKLRLPRFSGKNVDDYIVAGYNYPVSVKVLARSNCGTNAVSDRRITATSFARRFTTIHA